jgi:putative heme iron utilization protein
MLCLLAMMPMPKEEKSMKDQMLDLVKAQKTGVLSTNFEDAYPFGSLVPYALDAKNNPIIYISDLALHTQNLKKYNKVTLTVSKVDKKDIFNSSRATILAKAVKVEGKEVEELYFKRFPKAKRFNKLHDFSFYRLEVDKTYFVGGFGNIGWVD